MAIKKTGATAIKLIKPKYIVVTMFNGTETDDTPKGDSYIIETAVRDTVTLSPDENTSTDIECETSDTPILSVVTLGRYQVSSEIADVQDDILAAIGGFTIVGDKAYAPASYTERYCKLDVAFEMADDTLTAFVIPKLQLNTRLMIESLNSNIARTNLAGTAQSISVANGNKTLQTALYKQKNYTLPTASTASGDEGKP